MPRSQLKYMMLCIDSGATFRILYGTYLTLIEPTSQNDYEVIILILFEIFYSCVVMTLEFVDDDL